MAELSFETVDLVHKIIQKHTKQIVDGENIFYASDLTFRKLLEKVKEEGKEKILIIGKDKLSDIICNNLAKKKLIEVKIDGNPIKDFDAVKKSAPGKKWEIVATNLSDSYKHLIDDARIRIMTFNDRLKKLEQSSTRKFLMEQLFEYVDLKNSVLKLPLQTYLNSKEIGKNVRDEFLNDVTDLVIKYVDRLKKIHERQNGFFNNFENLIYFIEQRNDYNQKLGFGFWSSRKQIKAVEKVKSFLTINTNEIKHAYQQDVETI